MHIGPLTGCLSACSLLQEIAGLNANGIRSTVITNLNLDGERLVSFSSCCFRGMKNNLLNALIVAGPDLPVFVSSIELSDVRVLHLDTVELRRGIRSSHIPSPVELRDVS
jgi:hypothetical protein